MSRLAIVTGANKGIGLGITENLCRKFDGTVMLCSRDLTRGQEAVENLKSKGFNPVLHQLDTSDKQSIAKLAETIGKEYSGLDVLVNNAAIAFKNDSTVPFLQQARDTINVNFFATLDVCQALFPFLKPHARVVNVSSSAGMLKNVVGPEVRKRFADPNLTVEQLTAMMKEYLDDVENGVHLEKGWPRTAYSASKVALSALSFIQQRDFDKNRPNDDIVVNAVHPGYVDTDMTSHKGTLTVEQGAEAPSYLALLPSNVKEPRGGMVWFDKRIVAWDGE